MIIKLYNKVYNLPWRYIELFNALFMPKTPSKKPGHLVTGTIVLCAPDYFFAFYDHRSEMTASGETEEECLANLREMYDYFLNAEKAGQIEKPQVDIPFQIPSDWNIKKFIDTVSLI